MKIRYKILTLFLLFSIYPSIAPAEPGVTINKLMNEPVSLFDLGMYRLEYFMQNKYDAHLKIGLKYDWSNTRISKDSWYDLDNNKLYITIEPYNLPLELLNKYDTTDKLCELFISSFRSIFGFYTLGGKSASSYSRMGKYFSHLGYPNELTNTAYKEVEKITNIRLHFHSKNKPVINGTCIGPLVGTTFSR